MITSETTHTRLAGVAATCFVPPAGAGIRSR